MIRTVLTAFALFCAASAAAQDIVINDAYIPLAPPGVMSHAAYLTVANTGDQTRSLVGVTALGYGMAHLHQSTEQDGVAVMSMIHQLDIPAGQSIFMKPGSLHVMLMHPQGKLVAGEVVTLTLHFANGEDLATQARITPYDSGS